MRILVLIYEYPPVGGGGGKAAEEICRYLASRGHEVRVLTSLAPDLPAEETVGGVNIQRIPARRKERFRASFSSMAAYITSGLWHGFRLIRRWRPDVIHTHFAVPSGPLAWSLSHLTGIPYVLTAHLGDVPGGVPEKTAGWFRWVEFLTPTIWRSAARVTAVSEYTRQLALARYPVEIEVIPNAVDCRALDPGEIQTNQPARIVFAGRLQPQKNPLQIIQTLAALQDLPWQLTLLGDGPLRPDLEAEVANKELAGRVTLTGWVDQEEVIARFRQSDILFMPSLSEGLPVVGLQALAMGLAIVASHIGGFVDLVLEGENGYLVPPEDPARYQPALESLLTDSGRLLAFRQASRALAARFDIQVVGQAYEEVLTAASQGRPA